MEAPNPIEILKISARDLSFNLELLNVYLRLIKMQNIISMGINPTISAARMMPLRKKYIMTNIKPPIDKILRVVLLIIIYHYLLQFI